MAPPSDQHEHSARRSGSPGKGAAPAAPPHTLQFTLRPSWVAPSIARERVEAWLRAHRWPGASRDDLVLAVNEAVSNSVEHGYGVPPNELDPPGSVAVHADICISRYGTRQAEITIRDGGRWRPPSSDASTRGHGLLVMRACVDQLSVNGTAAGTTVIMTSRPVPELPRAE